MGTIDISEEDLVDVVALTEDSTSDNRQSAFCGDDHFVWIHEDSYGGELCYQEFDEYGAVGSPSCYFSGLGDRGDAYPSCDSTGTYIAWARETDDPNYAGNHEIWTTETADIEGEAAAIQTGVYDATMPVWSPDDTTIAFAWNRIWMGSSDYEIWLIASDTGGNDTNVTDNTDEDDEPAWGPVVLE